MKTLANNRKAFHDFEILEKFEAGIVLRGTEAKSCRQGNISLSEAHARIRDNELWLVGSHIAPYEQGNLNNHNPRQDRKLLVHRRELIRLQQATEAKGMTLVPLRAYLQRGRVKVEIGLGRGKARHDKREDLKRSMHERDVQRAIAAHC